MNVPGEIWRGVCVCQGEVHYGRTRHKKSHVG